MSTIESKFCLQVPSSTQNLAIIREFVSNVGAQAGFDDKQVGMLVLAVDEACANVIEHAYNNDSTQEVAIRADFDEEALHIDVEDTGRGFDPQSIPAKNIDELVAERKSGGLGMRLITQLMDEVHYEFEPGRKNVLRMTKRINK